MFILGLNAFHGDASAALVKDGKLTAAAEEEEERFLWHKHWAGFPAQAITYCLGVAERVATEMDGVGRLDYGFGARCWLALQAALGARRTRSAMNAFRAG